MRYKQHDVRGYVRGPYDAVVRGATKDRPSELTGDGVTTDRLGSDGCSAGGVRAGTHVVVVQQPRVVGVTLEGELQEIAGVATVALVDQDVAHLDDRVDVVGVVLNRLLIGRTRRVGLAGLHGGVALGEVAPGGHRVVVRGIDRLGACPWRHDDD